MFVSMVAMRTGSCITDITQSAARKPYTSLVALRIPKSNENDKEGLGCIGKVSFTYDAIVSSCQHAGFRVFLSCSLRCGITIYRLQKIKRGNVLVNKIN